MQEDTALPAAQETQGPSSGEAPTRPSFRGCSHVDMAGDTLIQVQGDRRWCTACGASWRDKDIVIVGDEVAA